MRGKDFLKGLLPLKDSSGCFEECFSSEFYFILFFLTFYFILFWCSSWIFFPIFISWRLITLQYCSGFLPYIDMNQSWIYMCSHPEPPSHIPPHPIPLGHPVHQPWALISCIQPGLVICFTLDNVHVSMLFSQIIPPSPSPIESKVCSIHLCLFSCPAYRVIVTIFLNSVYMR